VLKEKGISNAASSLPYAVSKAAALRMMKAFAATQGPKIRCNAVLPGLMLTEWGKQFSEDRVNQMKEAAVLKKVVCDSLGEAIQVRLTWDRQTDLDDCADVYIMLARNSSMTGIRIQVGTWSIPRPFEPRPREVLTVTQMVAYGWKPRDL